MKYLLIIDGVDSERCDYDYNIGFNITYKYIKTASQLENKISELIEEYGHSTNNPRFSKITICEINKSYEFDLHMHCKNKENKEELKQNKEELELLEKLAKKLAKKHGKKIEG